MYADHKKWDLQSVKVELKHEKIHCEDCSDTENTKSKIDFITKQITITGNLTEEQKDKIMAIAEKCPVNKTLRSTIRIDSI